MNTKFDSEDEYYKILNISILPFTAEHKSTTVILFICSSKQSCIDVHLGCVLLYHPMDHLPHHSILLQKPPHTVHDGRGEALVDEGDGGFLHLLHDLLPDDPLDLTLGHPDDPLGVLLRRNHHIYLSFSLRQTVLIEPTIFGRYFLVR